MQDLTRISRKEKVLNFVALLHLDLCNRQRLCLHSVCCILRMRMSQGFVVGLHERSSLLHGAAVLQAKQVRS